MQLLSQMPQLKHKLSVNLVQSGNSVQNVRKFGGTNPSLKLHHDFPVHNFSTKGCKRLGYSSTRKKHLQSVVVESHKRARARFLFLAAALAGVLLIVLVMAPRVT